MLRAGRICRIEQPGGGALSCQTKIPAPTIYFLMKHILLACALCLSLAAQVHAEQPAPTDKAGPAPLAAWPVSTSLAPLPLAERDLPAMQAVPYHQVSSEGHTLEGAISDGKGNLLFCDVTRREVLRLDASRKASVLVHFDTVAPGGLALHKDGRLFIAAINLDNNRGSIHALTADGKLETIVGPDKGYLPNDLAFDSYGGLYFTDFKGTATNPAGGVYYIAPDGKTITPVLPGIAQANGVGLSKDGHTLWVTECPRPALPCGPCNTHKGHTSWDKHSLPLCRSCSGLPARGRERQCLRCGIRPWARPCLRCLGHSQGADPSSRQGQWPKSPHDKPCPCAWHRRALHSERQSPNGCRRTRLSRKGHGQGPACNALMLSSSFFSSSRKGCPFCCPNALPALPRASNLA